MGDYDQEITAIEEQIERNEMPAAEDVLWLCRNLRAFIDEGKRLTAAVQSLQIDRARLSDECNTAENAAAQWRNIVSIYTSRFGAVVNPKRCSDEK